MKVGARRRLEDFSLRLPTTIGTALTITSTILDEDRHYTVHLPVTYDSKANLRRRYPVVYVLDGDSFAGTAASVIRFLSSNDVIPEMIVVGIDNTDRLRDFTPTMTLDGPGDRHHPSWKIAGGADAFVRFLAEELVPEIDRRHRTMPYRLIVGHSLGGLLAIEALQTMPTLFGATIAIDPSLWWDDAVLLRRALATLSGIDSHHRLYMANANIPEIAALPVAIYRDHANAIRDYAKLVEADPTMHGRFLFEYFADEDHGSIQLIALYKGLRFVFSGFKLTNAAAIDDPTVIEPHFARISEKLGATFLPPEALVNGLGYNALGEVADAQKAIAIFRINVANYPESSNVYDSLGEALQVDGDLSGALENYERSLALDAENANARAHITTLRTPA